MTSQALPDHASEPPLGAVPRQARSRATRAKILAAALRLFGELGVDQTRVEDIVAEARVSWGTFFHYFPRKEDVLLVHAAEQLRRVHALAAEWLDDPVTPVRDVVLRCYLALLEGDELPVELRVAAMREVTASARRFTAMLGDDEPTLFSVVMSLLAVGQQRGEVRADVPLPLLSAIVNAVAYSPVIRLGISNAAGIPAQRDHADLVRIAFDVVWEGAAAHTTSGR